MKCNSEPVSRASPLPQDESSLEHVLSREQYDFAAKYMASCRLNDRIRENPAAVSSQTVDIIETLYRSPRVRAQTQAYFLLRELSTALCAIAISNRGAPRELAAFSALFRILKQMSGHAHRAAAEALGSVPFPIQGPDVGGAVPQNTPVISLKEVLKTIGAAACGPIQRFGRSLVLPINHDGQLLVLKTGDPGQATGLHNEARWMMHLGEHGGDIRDSFQVPRLVRIKGAGVFQLDLKDHAHPVGIMPPGVRHAVAFITGGDYFTYPNDPRQRLKPHEFEAVLFENAYLFGRLSAQGMVHSAPIPLFHNRVQAFRRRDQGVYEWQRGGRLDQWLHSCRYPNFGRSGIRDFEHFFSFTGRARGLYPHVGTQFMSLFLVTASYFRSKSPETVGVDQGGEPVDARHLFDKGFLAELITGLFDHYYHGFCGSRFSGVLPVDINRLSERIIKETGVDRHMEEILRAADQKEMDRAEFRSFLKERGYTKAEARRTRQGIGDITLQTGPHLGGFNQRISLPELIEAVATMTCLCLLGRYCRVSGLDLGRFYRHRPRL